MIHADIANQLALDVNSLAQTRRLAKDDPRAALKSAAQQFEAVFLQMVLKAMRDASPKEGIFDSEQSRLYQSLLDQQLAQTLSAKGSTGLAALIEQQLARGLPPQDTQGTPSLPRGRGPGRGGRLPPPAHNPLPRPSLPPGGEREPNVPAPAREFVNRLWSHAGEASRATGIPAHFMIAQAALETGWGRSELRFSDGAPTYNLFGIKAGRSWQGAVAEATTTEYVNGVAQKSVERFRAYASYGEAFRDYANLLASNPRYAEVLNQQDAAGFARGLQRAGYATDPMYAAKLERIIGGAALRDGLTG
ncbi:MAG: flagellar assembly peptidoglycan hydrolase FlgJ [Rhodocyclaceae bacterium]|nr:flagellar assembly peptidoglycan hydrolase FlgJ [Rhodocyclaceae bacterium]